MSGRSDSSGVLCVIGGFLVHLVLGTLYCWANLTTYVTARMRLFDSSVTYERTLLVFATCIGAQGCTMLAAGFVESRVGARHTCLLGGYILSAGILLCSQATTLPSLLLFNGVFFGVGLGLAYSAPISASARWFPEQKGLVTGIIISGFGGGAFLFGSIANALVNPDNLAVSSDGYFDPKGPVASNVPTMYIFLGCLYLAFITVGGLLISEPSPEESFTQKGTGYQILSDDSAESHISTRESIELNVDQIIKAPIAWHLALCLITTALGGMFLAGTFKTFAISSVDSLSLGIISTAASVFNSGTRFSSDFLMKFVTWYYFSGEDILGCDGRSFWADADACFSGGWPRMYYIHLLWLTCIRSLWICVLDFFSLLLRGRQFCIVHAYHHSSIRF